MRVLQKTFSNADACLLDLDASSIDSAFEQTVQHLVDQKLIAPGAYGDIVTELKHREEKSSTAIGHAVGVPHCYLDSMIEQIVVFVRLKHPLNMGAPDRIATRYLFFLLGPTSAIPGHLDTLALIARLMSDDEFRYDLGEAKEHQSLFYAFERAVQRSKPSPAIATSNQDDGLEYTGKIAGGLIQDVKRRLPKYWSDFTDGLHPKAVASTLFLFFACLAPTVTFGGVMSIETNGDIGAVEMIVATAMCGVIYALFSAQPLNILGGTGPLLVFTAILYNLCHDMQIDFLPAYAWVGIWTALITILLAVTDASFLMRYFTRFTNEIFSALISVIYIYNAIKALIYIFKDLDAHQHHDTALLSLLLALGTFYIAITLQGSRRSRYMLPWMREFLADFGPTIALGVMTLVAFRLHEVDLPVLPAPDQLGTTSGRAWFVDPFAAPMWVRWAALAPAILGAILIYVDQNITARLVNCADHRLKKGGGYHLDLALIGGMVGLCSIFGLPWVVAATVRSLNHVRSLATTEEVVTRSGDRRDRILRVRETRITGLAIHLLIGASLLLLPLLKTVPMAVLYGLFLFMGFVSIRGNQFFERISLWLMEPSLYPSTHFIRRVPLWSVHVYTAIQLISLIVLWTVKESSLGLLFPLFLAMLVPLRFSLSYFFRQPYLAVLDADSVPED
ncbi:PTS sugar transporter subunit IIA [Thalassoglobus sp.]|uniref:PTS sugar transporter subunit IIA n=1 Tax=Thalassoglobus sp. TaxID=2795869 RepID=UPI003AA922FB